MWSLETYAPGARKLCYVRSMAAPGPPLALIHGVLRGWDYMLPLSLRLAGGYEMWAVDQRGHGMSDRADRYLTVDYLADAVAWLREAVGKPTTLYGHSLGAMVAAAVAAECPELVRGVILEDPPFHTLGNRIGGSGFQNYFAALAPLVGSQEPVASLAKRLAEVSFTDPASGTTTRMGDVRDPVALRFFAASLRRCDPKVVEPIVAGTWLDGYDCEVVFSKLRMPVLLLEADRAAGGMLDTAEVELMKRLAADVSHIRMPGVGHAMHWQRTQEVANLTIAFLESLDGAS